MTAAARRNVPALIVVTACGFAKRVPLDDLPAKSRNRGGVIVSSRPVAAVVTVADDDGDVLIATAAGQVERVAVADIPVRRRRVRARGNIAKGSPVIALNTGDRVACLVLAAPAAARSARVVPQIDSAALRAKDWPGGTVGLRAGERIAAAVIFSPPGLLGSLSSGGRPIVEREAWARTAVHRASTYFCGHCGDQLADPHAVYACIDRHIAAAALGSRRAAA